jgi:hypothetical protein
VLSWQPAVFYALDAVLVAAVLGGPRGRWRAVCRVVVGGLVPLVVTVAGFAAVGALDDFVAATVSYPLTGAPGGDGGVAGSTRRLWEVVDKHAGGPLFWLGWVLLLVVVAMGVATHRPVRRALQQPLVCVVLVTGVAELLFATTNFQGYPDTYPLLPYVCLGYGGAVALARRARWGWVRVATAAVVLVALAAVTVVRWHEAHLDPSVGQLSAQRSDACGLDRIVVPGTSLYSIGDPVPLVLTHRTNPDRYIYLGMAVDVWKLRHSSGGLGGWLRSIQRSDPSVIVFQSYSGRYSDTLKTMIRQSGFHRRYLGEWRVFLTSEARARARAEGVRLTRHRTPVATSRHGRRPLPAFHCQHINDATGGSRA